MMMNLPEVPPADEVTAGWWDATREHHLVVQRCANCQHLQHPPRAVCTECSSMDHLELAPTSGKATIDTFTVIYRAPRPDVEVPFTLARVRLQEGPILLTRLLHSNDWTIGDEVSIDWLDLPDGRALPVFTK